MKQKIRRSRFAQSRIDYITYGNPDGVRKLVYDLGYEPPSDIHDLVDTTRRLIKKKGRKVVKELVKLHPDRGAILKIERVKEDSFCSACSSYSYNGEDNYCGVCGHSNYDGSGNPDFLDRLVSMGAKELEEYYENLIAKSVKNPGDSNLAEEIQLAFNELRKRKSQKENRVEQPEENNGIFRYKDELIIGSLCLLTGILISSPKLFGQKTVNPT